MLVNKSVDREWKPTGTSGVERSLFRNNEAGGRSSVVRLKKGARVPRHAHHGEEEVVVLSRNRANRRRRAGRRGLSLHAARRRARCRRIDGRGHLRFFAEERDCR